MESAPKLLPTFDAHEPAVASTSKERQRSRQQLRKPPRSVTELEPLLTAEDVAKRLNVSTDWVWDHSSRKKPLLPVIRMGDGALRYRASRIEAFIDEREQLSAMRRRVS